MRWTVRFVVFCEETFKFPIFIYLISVDSVIMIPHSSDHQQCENLISTPDLWPGTFAGYGTLTLSNLTFFSRNRWGNLSSVGTKVILWKFKFRIFNSLFIHLQCPFG